MRPLLVIRRALLVLALPLILVACGGSSDTDPADLAARIGASHCERTSFAIENKVSGESAVIYDCYRDYQNICVTEENDIAKDETAAVTALFASSLGTETPRCAR